MADFLIKMAQAPHLVSFGLTIDVMKQRYSDSIAPKI